MRHHGQPVQMLVLRGEAEEDGKLALYMGDAVNVPVAETERDKPREGD